MQSTRCVSGFVKLWLLTIVCSAQAGPSSNRDAVAIAAIKAELEAHTQADEFSGAVAIYRAGQPVYTGAFGYADRESRTPNTLQTRFRFGSMGKMFTAVAIMQLVDTGKLRLDDTVAKILKNYPNQNVGKVTIAQLLTHTGGTGDIFGPDFMSQRESLKELNDYVTAFGERGTEFEPGSQHRYSNYGFILLGRIVEVVSGQSYYDYVRDRIFVPTGMLSTDNQPETSHVKDLARGYTSGLPMRPGPGPVHHDAPLRAADDSLPYRGTSAGGGYSTVGDLQKFADALLHHRLLSASLTAMMTEGKVDTPRRGLRYAYGFEDATSPGSVRRIGHGGGAPGMNGVLWIYPESAYVIAVLANLDPPAAQEIARFIERQLQME